MTWKKEVSQLKQIKEFNSLSDLCVDIYETSSKSKIFTICSKPTIGLEGETEFVEITQDDIISATENLRKDSVFTPDILDNCNSLSYKCYTTYIELQKEVDDAFKEAIERITNIISEI